MLAATLLLAQPDATGDARGDGSYILPSGLKISEANLDLRELRAEAVDGQLRLTVTLGALANPWNAPQGFSGPIVDIFVKTRIGGRQVLDLTGLSTPAGDGWQYHFRLDGLTNRWWSVPEGQTTATPRREPLSLRVQGTSLVLDTPLKAGQYSYWVTSSVFSPFTQDGLLRPGTQPGPAALASTLPEAPPVVDLIGAGDQARAYLTRVLAPVGQVRDRRSLALLIAGGAGLLVALVASFLVWRKQ